MTASRGVVRCEWDAYHSIFSSFPTNKIIGCDGGVVSVVIDLSLVCKIILQEVIAQRYIYVSKLVAL
jgi:hypothetical protein